MKKFSVYLLIILFLLISPLVAVAHGGVEKRTGNILVTLFQSPLSPLVGEKVNFSFILTDPSANHRYSKKTARLVITQTAFNNPSGDKIIYTKQVVPDVNGTIAFAYSFPTTNYYDIDLQFGKPDDESTTTGFLVQPRENLSITVQELLMLVSISLIINIVILGYWVLRKKSKDA